MKTLIATITYNSNQITNDCFLTSLYKQCDASKFDILIVNTDENEFKLSDNILQPSNKIKCEQYNKKFKITSHSAAVQKILDEYSIQYDNIIICENDVIIKQDLLNIIDVDYEFVGKQSTASERSWYTAFYNKFRIQCNRWFPMLMYFNTKKRKDFVFCKFDVSIKMSIPSLNLQQESKNIRFGDPGWYFLLWTIQNNIKCKNINIDDYISHFWYGSENRNKSPDEYAKRLEEFKQANIQYL